MFPDVHPALQPKHLRAQGGAIHSESNPGEVHEMKEKQSKNWLP